MRLLKNSVLKNPTPVNINYMWNFGSLLGLCIIIQIVTGFMLSMKYDNNITTAFDSVVYIMRDVNYGWLFRVMHANGASLFFLMLYLHMARGIYYGSYKLTLVWLVGNLLLILVMAASFLGYVLPWGQMSYWGASVITSLMSTIPFVGQLLVEWVWGGPSIGNATLGRFFSLHFLIPFIILLFTLSHIILLHESLSSNPLGTDSKLNMIPFHSYFSYKDIFIYLLVLILFIGGNFYIPFLTFDASNFMIANPMSTPTHIQPEWYFLWVYAILRSIPNKAGGVLFMVISLLFFSVLPVMSYINMVPTPYSVGSQVFFMFIIVGFILLTYIGACPVEDPYLMVGIASIALYYTSWFGFFLSKHITYLLLYK